MADQPKKIPDTYSEGDLEMHIGASDTHGDILHDIAIKEPSEANHEDIAEHPKAHPHTLQHIYDNAHKHPSKVEIKQKVLAHPNAPKELIHSKVAEIKPEDYHGWDDKDEHLFHPGVDPKIRHEKVKEIIDPPPGKIALSYSQQSALYKHVRHENTSAEHINELAQHSNRLVRKAAVTSEKCDIRHRLNHINESYHSDLNDFVKNSSSLHPDLARAVHQRMKSMQHDEDEVNDLTKTIAQHPNTPQDLLEEIISTHSKPDEHGGFDHEWDHPRQEALSNRNFPKEKLAELAQNSLDEMAHHALVTRDDTDPEHLRLLAGTYNSPDGYGHKSRVSSGILAHPNTPHDVLKAAIGRDTASARAVMERKELPEEFLKDLVSHKNKNVAIDALKHPSVTKDVVDHAFKRKAADVSRAAAKHHLATAEMKTKKALSDPKAAIEAAGLASDPEILAQLHDGLKSSSINKREFHMALTKNQNTPSSVLDQITDHMTNHEALGAESPHLIDRHWKHREVRQQLASHPNLSRQSRKKLVDTGHLSVLSHEGIEPDELEQHLESLRGQMNSGDIDQVDMSDAARMAARHPNVTPELASRYLKGDFGKVEDRYGDSVNFHSDAYTPDVIKAGLKTPEEFMDQGVKERLATSKNLSVDDIQSIHDSHAEKANAGDLHAQRVVRGLLRNENAPSDFIKKKLEEQLGSTNPNDHHIEAALGNKNLADEDVDQLASKLDKNHPESYKNALARRLGGAKLSEKHAATSSDPDFVSSLMMRGGKYSSDLDKDALRGAMNNPNPAVVKAAIDSADSYRIKNLDPKAREEMFDSLNEKNPEAAKHVFSHMTPAGQKMYIEKYGANDPSVIKNMTRDALGSIKIDRNSSQDVVDAVLRHPNTSDDHLSQAVDHSAASADQAVERMYASRGETEKTKPLIMKALDMHAGHHTGEAAKMLGRAAASSSDPEILNKVFENIDKLDRHGVASLLKNSSVKPSEFDRLTGLKGPDYSHVMGSVARSHKATVKLLSHIAESYPEHLAEIASHPRAASAKVLKHVVDKGDDNAHLNLIHNEKVPQGIKDELLKNPRLLLRAKPNSVGADVLAEHAKSDDLDLVQMVAGHANSTPQTLSDVAQHALKLRQGDGDEANQAHAILAKVARRRDLLPSTQRDLAEADPKLAYELIRDSGGAPMKRDPGVLLDALKKHEHHEDQASVKALHSSLLNRNGLDHPELIEHLIQKTGLDEDYGSRSGSESLSQMISSSSGISDKHIEMVHNRLKTERGVGHTYSGDGKKQIASDAYLVRAIAKKAPPAIQHELADNGIVGPDLFVNPKLDRDVFMKIAASPATYTRNMDSASAKALGGSPHLTPDLAEKVLQNVRESSHSMDEYAREVLTGAMAKRRDLSPKATEALWKEHNRRSALASPNMPKDVVDKELKDGLSKANSADTATYLIQLRPGMTLAEISKHLPEDEAGRKSALDMVGYYLARNPTATSDDLRSVYHAQDVGRQARRRSSETDGFLLKNANTPDDVIHHMLQNHHCTEEDAMAHPGVGGQLWRSRKHEFPRLKGVSKGNEINQASYREREEKLKKVMAMIPEGQHIEWGAFKKAYPGLANDPLVNKMFVSAPKQRLTQEHAQQYFDSLPAKNFHVSYRSWNGIQRHNERHEDPNHAGPELVVNLNNGEEMDKEFKKNPKLGGLFRMVQNASNYSGHPITPQCIGWSRVDTSHPDHWFVDEIQSDFNSHLSEMIRDVVEKGGTDKLHEYGIEPEESEGLVRQMVEKIQGWEKALMNNIVETAKKHGVKKLSIQSGKSKTLVNKGRGKEVTHKYKKIYDTMPQDMGFQPSTYQDLPHHDAKGALADQPIWTLDLGGGEDPNQLGLPFMGGDKKDPKKAA